MSVSRKRWAAGLVVAATAGVAGPSPAEACYDGYEANVRKASASVGDDARWDPDVARSVATWLTRIDALLPDGVSVIVYPWGVECEGPACAEAHHDVKGGFATAFAVTARNVGASPGTVRRARALGSEPVTIQVYAGAWQSARALAARIGEQQPEDAAWTGFYDAGGFPAFRPAAHVVRATLPDGSVVHRVVVGAFLTVADAQGAQASLSAATGLQSFVRPLADVGRPVDTASAPDR